MGSTSRTVVTTSITVKFGEVEFLDRVFCAPCDAVRDDDRHVLTSVVAA